MRCDEFQELYDLLLDAQASQTAELDTKTRHALLEHRRNCARCQAEAAESDALAAELRALPFLEAPSVRPPWLGERPVAAARSPAGWRAVLASAAAAMLTVTTFSFFRPDAFDTLAALEGVEVLNRGAEGLLTTARPVTFTPRGGIALRVERDSQFRIAKDTRSFHLKRGQLTARVEPGQTFRVSTPHAGVLVKGTVFSVRVKDPRDAHPFGKVETMDSFLKTIGLSALVSVVVSAGTVTVYNRYGEADVRSAEMGVVSDSGQPQVVALADALAEIEATLADTRSAVMRLEEQAPTESAAWEERVRQIADAQIAEGHEPRASDAQHPPRSEEEQIEALTKAFDKLSNIGVAAYQHPDLGDLAEELRGMGAKGRSFVVRELLNESKEKRFLAAAVAEKLKDPELIAPLEQAVLEDDDFLVRRMSSHALAFMEHEEAGDALVNILDKETRDSGVRINAWYGLASLGHPETVPAFKKILDEAGGELPPDFVVDTALKVTDAKMLPALRYAYDQENVSVAMKTRILRTLGEAESREYEEFLRAIAQDPNADESLRSAASRALEVR